MPVTRHLSPSPTFDMGVAGRSKGKKRAGAPYIPRPPNSFMLFRAQREADYKQHLRPGEPKLHQSELSREIGQAWRSLSPVARAAYQDEAARRAAEHKALYPDYVYRPETKEEKVARQKQEKEKRAAATAARRAEKGRKRKSPQKPALTTIELSLPRTMNGTSPTNATTDGRNTPTTTASSSPPGSSPYDTRPSTSVPSAFSITPATVIERYGDLGPTPAASCCTSYASTPSNEFTLAPEPAPLTRSDPGTQPPCGAASSVHQFDRQNLSVSVPSWQAAYDLHQPTPSYNYWAHDLQNFTIPLAPSDGHNEYWIPSPEDFVVPMPLNMDPSMHVPPPSISAHMGAMPDLGGGEYADGMDPLSKMFESYEWDSYGSLPSTSSGSGHHESPLPLPDFPSSAAAMVHPDFHHPAPSKSPAVTSPIYDNMSNQGNFFQLNLDLSCPPVPTPSPYGSYYNTPIEATHPTTWALPQYNSSSQDAAPVLAPPLNGFVRQWAA